MFIFLNLMAIPFLGISQNNSMLIKAHVEKLKNAKLYAIEIANKLNDDKYDFKPIMEEMSFKEQLIHIGENIYWLSSTYLKEETNPIQNRKIIPNEVNKDQVLNFVNNAYDYALLVLNDLDTASLSKEFNFYGRKLNKFQFLNLVQDHQSHHIGQLIVYLRLNGIQPPKYIGW